MRLLDQLGNLGELLQLGMFEVDVEVGRLLFALIPLRGGFN